MTWARSRSSITAPATSIRCGTRWSSSAATSASRIFEGFRRDTTFYFTHSFHLALDDPSFEAAYCEYGGRFTAAVLKDNVVATQFHPEKSQENGLKLLENFLQWKP